MTQQRSREDRPEPPAGDSTGAPIRVALIGAGAVARRHAEVLTGLGASVAAVADPVEAAASAAASAYGAAPYATASEALDHVEVDAVYVCVPPYAHGEPERAALARGLPLFVEKPLAVDMSTAEELAAEISAAGIVTGTGYHWRCLDTLSRARQLLVAEPAVLATGSWVGSRPPPAWWSRRSLCGGQVIEQLTHVLDLARVLLGEPVEVHATATQQADGDDDEVEDATAATVRFDSGAVATFATSCVLDARQDASLRLVAPGAALVLTETELRVSRGGGEETYRVQEDPRTAVDRDFLQVLRGERLTTVAPYADALETHRLGCAIAESARRHESVHLGRDPRRAQREGGADVTAPPEEPEPR
jgi:predicted dehydrogenase